MMKTEMKMNDWGLDSLTPKIGDAVKNICKCLDGMTIKDAETVLKMVFDSLGSSTYHFSGLKTERPS